MRYFTLSLLCTEVGKPGVRFQYTPFLTNHISGAPWPVLDSADLEARQGGRVLTSGPRADPKGGGARQHFS